MTIRDATQGRVADCKLLPMQLQLTIFASFSADSQMPPQGGLLPAYHPRQLGESRASVDQVIACRAAGL